MNKQIRNYITKGNYYKDAKIGRLKHTFTSLNNYQPEIYFTDKEDIYLLAAVKYTTNIIHKYDDYCGKEMAVKLITKKELNKIYDEYDYTYSDLTLTQKLLLETGIDTYEEEENF